MAVKPVSPTEVGRKRRVHKKSRYGCQGCKLRSVKCDESKPTCKKCASYGVICKYGPTTGELQLSVEGANHIILDQGLPYWQCKSDELLEKFQVRTALTVSFGKRLEVYQEDIAALACTNPPLYHAIITLTMAHDRCLSSDPRKSPSAQEYYHWSRALSAFNKQLYRIPQGDEPAALLTTAAALGVLTCYHIEATTPEEAWPLATSSPSDLAWLKMSDGKKEVFKLTQRSDAESTPLFRKLTTFYTNEVDPASSNSRPAKLEASLPPMIFRLYDFDPARDADDTDDPLKWAASRLAQILATNCAPSTVVLGFLMLISAMRPDFKELLIQKEPRALLLLAWFFAKVNQLDLWWLSRRSLLEGQAICIYLEEMYPNDGDMVKLLEYPKSVFAAQVASDKTKAS